MTVQEFTYVKAPWILLRESKQNEKKKIGKKDIKLEQ